MTDKPALTLFNSLTRKLEAFEPIHEGEARVYSCGPTVYNYQHVGNMRAYVFADTLGRVLSWRGYDLTHVINITDVGHLTSDADAGDDKMEKAAARTGKSAWDIARHYQDVFEADLARLNVRKPAHPRATDYVEAMIDWARQIEDGHCYRLDSGLYFDVSTVPDYGRLARASTDEGAETDHARIETVEGKRHAADFAIWRTTPPGENRQMEWDSPWGRGAPGWHIECSVMSAQLLGQPFDIHTGGIDHREIHHPNEIAQNQAMQQSQGECAQTGARIWMHNNFLVDRRGKMSKSTGDFLTLQALVDRGYHPLAYRMLCLQAHYRSELEFTWAGLAAALTRLKRLVMAVQRWQQRHEERGEKIVPADAWEGHPRVREMIERFAAAISSDLNTAEALVVLEDLLAMKKIDTHCILSAAARMDEALGLGLRDLSRDALRLRPVAAIPTEEEITLGIERRAKLRAEKDFAGADAIRDELAARGVELMDGDPLGWDWKLS